ncbi:MAG: cation diffusion facilitator family transporter [Pseudomonadota bacterium]|nr:cation diffusion facilitator family transporter [Pseudomonadota bacterium]
MAQDHDNASLLRLATRASVITASILIVVKLGAWLVTGSVSVLASLVDSLLDAAASVITLYAVRYSLEPADEEHRFGHGKAEYLAGLAQSTFIGGSAILLMLMSIDRLMHPQPVEHIGVGVGVMIFSIAATLVLLMIQRHVIRRTGSVAIRGDSLHYLTDFFTNVSIIVALVLSAFGWPGFDPLFAMGIALYILYSAWHIGYDAVQLLLDRELPVDVQENIRRIANRHGSVRGIHELRTRQSGRTWFIQLHLEMDGTLELRTAHRVADEVEVLIKEAYPEADVIIHEDPFDPSSRN